MTISEEVIISKNEALKIPEDGDLTLFTCMIGGAAGDGIMSAGQLFTKLMVKNSYYAQLYTEYPSLIRGGHNMVTIRVSDSPVTCQVSHVDILFAINLETIELHIDAVVSNGLVIYDPTILRRTKVEDFNRPDVKFLPIPLRDMVKELGATKVVQNTIGVAAIVALVGLPMTGLERILKQIFVNKPAIAELNIKAAEMGEKYVQDNFDKYKIQCQERDDMGLMTISGNKATAAGLIAGGLSVYTGYPMSPASSLLDYMVEFENEYDYMVMQAEDEISAIMMSIGANHAGVRAATGTSGGGMSLMVESIGLSGSAEIPLVVIDVMRPGPSTGLPTWTGQADLLFAVSLGQDSFPRIVIAPGDVQECFRLSAEALNLAEEFQVPVIVLTDKLLGSSEFATKPFSQDGMKINTGKTILLDNKSEIDQDYKRYKVTEDGVSMRAIPGLPSNYIFRSTGNEHNEYGRVNDTASNRIVQMDKRMNKIETIKLALPTPQIIGVQPAEADITFFTWGSTKGAIEDVIKRIRDKKICLVHTSYVWPFPANFIQKAIDDSKNPVLVEGNYDAQFGQLIRNFAQRDIKNKILRYDGRPLDPVDIVKIIKPWLY